MDAGTLPGASFNAGHHHGAASPDGTAAPAQVAAASGGDHHLSGASFNTDHHDAATAPAYGPPDGTAGKADVDHASGASFTQDHPDYSAAGANYSLPDGTAVQVDPHGHIETGAAAGTSTASGGEQHSTEAAGSVGGL